MITIPRVSPGHGLFAATGQIWATMQAEITMQWRRWGFWVAFACTTGLVVLLTVETALYFLHLPPHAPYIHMHLTSESFNNLLLYGTTTYGVMFFGLVIALLVVDRMERDQRLGMLELQYTTPQGYASYVLGKFLGNYIAVLLPVVFSYLLCALITIALGWPGIMLQKFLLDCLLVFVPASLATVGLTLLLTSFLPVRVVQVGFSLLWILFNIAPGWDILSRSIFTPNGLYVIPVFFPLPPMPFSLNVAASLPLALLNITVLVSTAIVTLGLTSGSVAFQRQRAEGR